MRLLVQRVSRAEVRADGASLGAIGRGMVVLIGVGPGDNEELVRRTARRVAQLRVFEDDQGRTNLSLLDVGGSALVVSQFTLYADTRRGRRPGFGGAADPVLAERLYLLFAAELGALEIPVSTGRFGAAMEVELVNLGPFTIWLDTDT